MTSNKRVAAAGQIFVHAPSSLTLCRTQSPVDTLGCIINTTHCSVRSKASQGTGDTGGQTSEECHLRPPRGAWLSHASFRQLQAKLNAENQGLCCITQHLMDNENGFVKDLDHLLCQQETAKNCKSEFLHKQWTERVWLPIQRSVENQVSRCYYEQVEKIRNLFLRYLNHCNVKGFVFPETYNPKYNPFLLKINRPHYFTVFSPVLRDPLFLQSHERIKEKRTLLHCQTGHNYTHRQVKHLLQHNLPHLEPLTDPLTSNTHLRSADLSILAPPTHLSSTPRPHPLAGVKTGLRRSERHVVTPYQI